MGEKRLLEAAVLAGEIMLVSGAEVYRVEDTMNRLLGKSTYHMVETIVSGTGIYATLDDPEKEPLTLVKRIPQRSTNVNRIYLVNDISRRFCNNEISLEQMCGELEELKTRVQYRPWMRALGHVWVSMFFAPMFGGGIIDFCAAAAVGVFLAMADWLVRRIRLNDFCVNAFCAFMVAVSAMTLRYCFLRQANVDVLVISGIMPLVPGVTFTTAIRDTLNGDYTAGSARMMEAIVIALAVAVGVGCGMLLFQALWGGFS